MTTDASQLVYTALKKNSASTAHKHLSSRPPTLLPRTLNKFQTYAGDYGKRTLATALDQICADKE